MDPVEIELLADAAWPAAHQERVGPWKLRATGGSGRRLNSVFTATRERVFVEEARALVEQAESLYAARGQRAAFQLSAATQAEGLDEYLAGRGYFVDGVSEVWTAVVSRSYAGDGRVVLSDRADAAWLDCAVESGDKRKLHAQVIGRIAAPCCFAAVHVDGEAVGCGMAVSQEGCAGIFCMATRANYRRRGIGSAVLRALLKWAADRNDRTAYLQVMKENGAAQALYSGHGFRRAYDYHYRIAGD